MLDDGAFLSWELELASRYPLALSEMRWPSVPLGRPENSALARWGIEVRSGWRGIVEQVLDPLEAAIAAQPADHRDRYRIVQLREKFGRLVVYFATAPTVEIRTAIQAAEEASVVTCECAARPGGWRSGAGGTPPEVPPMRIGPWDQLD